MRSTVTRITANCANFVLLDRVEPGIVPPYCVHGKATCVGCDDWVWLGSETYAVVASEQAAPLCRQCSVRYIPPGTRPSRHLEDHRRLPDE